jgi:uncharacterized repeat protein (TIGR03803 family)
MSKFGCGMRACGIALLWAATAAALTAQTFKTLHSFDGTDGSNPVAGLVQATNGNLYGTTQQGGANGAGTVFKITASGTLTTLHSFNNTDGSNPVAGLVQAANGDLYGTTESGGANNLNGTVFKITPSGALVTLHSFCSQMNNGMCTDGNQPEAGLVQATNGKLYGTTGFGGVNGDGTVFEITPSGTLTTLHSFDKTDGDGPAAGLVQGTHGNLYGTTYQGGANDAGTVFKITPSGTLTTLHSFDDTDGYAPDAALIQGTDGNFYGTTQEGGANGAGTIFKITPNGTLTTLHSFNNTDGFLANAALVQGTDANFYGTMLSGGANNYGTVFQITAGGTLTTLYNFCSQGGCPDGAAPQAGLVQDTNGDFYGTASEGGASSNGTIFSVSVGLGPFVETQPTSGKVGASVKILGTNLTGATSVTFNGTAAAFTVKSKSEITTTVPTGATTGTVQVVTSGGTLSSNVPFRVK